MNTGRMSINKFEVLLAAVLIARSTSLIIVKASLADFDIFNLMALRFCIAFVCILPFLRTRASAVTRKAIRHGFILGAVFFTVIAVELLGLKLTGSATTVSFIENMSIVMVPVTAAVLKKKLPERRIIIAAAVAFTGVGFLLTGGGRIEINNGTAVCLLTAVLYTAYVLLTDKLSKEDDPLVLGAVQLGVVGALSAMATLVFETPRMPAGGIEWAGIVLLAVICGSIGTALQPVAQSRVSAEKAGIFCAVYPLTACSLGWAFLGEWTGPSGLIGAALIVSAIFITNKKDAGRQAGIRGFRNAAPAAPFIRRRRQKTA